MRLERNWNIRSDVLQQITTAPNLVTFSVFLWAGMQECRNMQHVSHVKPKDTDQFDLLFALSMHIAYKVTPKGTWHASHPHTGWIKYAPLTNTFIQILHWGFDILYFEIYILFIFRVFLRQHNKWDFTHQKMYKWRLFFLRRRSCQQ